MAEPDTEDDQDIPDDPRAGDELIRAILAMGSTIEHMKARKEVDVIVMDISRFDQGIFRLDVLFYA